MRTIQITIEEELLERLDQAIAELGANRSAFIRQALQQALHTLHIRQLEEQQRRGYAQHPVAPDEFDLWESERRWGDE
jgi:metal-responsive CopG/Arc/MetJ family transcriptional regulator